MRRVIRAAMSAIEAKNEDFRGVPLQNEYYRMDRRFQMNWDDDLFRDICQ